MMEVATMALMLAILFMLSGARGTPSQNSLMARRLRRLERRLDAVIEHLGIALPPEPPDDAPSAEVRRLVREGKMIQAIKAHRDETGAGLAEAKAVIDGLRANPDAGAAGPPSRRDA